MKNSFGNICRQWRKQRRYSQLQLAVEMEVSSKHISFIETGRSHPSRAMVIKIGTFLSVSKREINRGLSSAGYAPAYSELPYEHEDLKLVFSAVDQMIENHMPYPAIVLNQSWDVIKYNASALELLKNIGFSTHNNLIEAVIHHKNSTKIINWQESAAVILSRVRHEISLLGVPDRLEQLENQLSDSLDRCDNSCSFISDQSVLSIRLKVPGAVLSFFSIIAELGSVQDVAVGEFKVELMFPADEETVNYYKLVK